MVNTIPAVSRMAGRGRWLTTSSVFLSTSAIAGAFFGLILGVLGLPIVKIIGKEDTLLILAVIVFALGLGELGLVSIPRLQRDKQVPATWRGRFPPEIVAALYGSMLGVGVLTRITFASFYGLVIWTLLSGAVVNSAFIFGTFGFVRAMPPVLFGPWLRNSDVAYSFTVTLVPLQWPVSRLSGFTLITLGVGSVAWWLMVIT